MLKRSISLAEMRQGEVGVVAALKGGPGFCRRLEVLGLRPGQRLTKVSGSFAGGPVTVRLGNIRVALGYGMAKRVVVEVEEREST